MGSTIDELNIPATKEIAKNIKALDKSAVHKICSGQVVISLAIAVKELLENALDAGATTVEIRLKEYGSELIEVIDNGSGVEECNFAGLTLKHYTSKIQQFEDLLSVTTFGFRGEALSSLTALSKLSITTRHSSCEFAHRIEYDHNGRIVKKIRCARPIGTTVTLEKLFFTLPVRHKEFNKNLKREFTKMCNLLYSYCLASTGVKIICTNVTSKGAKTTVAATQATNSIKDNISCIFGHTQLASLIQIEQSELSPNICEEYNIDRENIEIPFEITGFISNCKPGCGRSTQDRQFYYVNSRPCEIPKLSKLVNEIYHQFNNSQYPFVLFNIKIKTSMVDVNVTPDKRKLFLNNEKILLAVTKSSLLTLFKKHAPCFDTSSQTLLAPTGGNIKKRSLDDDDDPLMKSQVMRALLHKRVKINENKVANLSEQSSDEEEEGEETIKNNFEINKSQDFDETPNNKKQNGGPNKSEFLACKIEREKGANKPNLVDYKTPVNDIPDISQEKHPGESNTLKFSEIEIKNEENDTSEPPAHEHTSNENQIKSEDEDRHEILKKENKRKSENDENETSQQPEYFIEEIKIPIKQETEIQSEEAESDEPEDVNASEFEKTEEVEMYDLTQTPTRNHITLDVTLDIIRNKLSDSKRNRSSGNESCKFRAPINPFSNSTAEAELQREITKESFGKMEIIGQFNLGFIIAKLENDLFIVDQHATDEKYNFEMLERTTVLARQKLVLPQKLELTTANKTLLLDNIDVFNKNGFAFDVRDTESGQDIFLTEIPLSKNVVFGRDDIDDLLFMLHNGSQGVCRPSRIRNMLASRACRKSVMIGSALSTQDMQRLITHMGEIEHPWNCPHGRPTIRHLINLSLVDESSNNT